MAGRANPLTKRVTTPASAEFTWSMPAGDFRAFMDSMQRLGYDTAPLMGVAGLKDADLADPDVRIPCEALGAIASLAQRTRFTPNLPLELARVTPLGAYPLLDYVVVTSDTAGSAVRQLARYARLVGNPVVIDVHDDSGTDVRVELSSGTAPFGIEFLASLMILHLHRETDGRFAASSIAFRHALDDAHAFGQILGCTVRSGSSWSGMVVPQEAWQLPLRRRDPVLRGLLESQADDLLARLPQRAGLVAEVQRALTARVISGDARIGTIARQLAMSGRTLQRRLAAEGVSYQQLVDDARKEAAWRYLAEPTLAIGEVAYLVGYSEPAPFHRAFKRWYGMTPDAARRRGPA